MRQAIETLTIQTRRKGLIPITESVAAFVADSDIETGLLTLWCRHTSASLVVQENADPTVRTDIERYFDALVPEDHPYIHDYEGPDDMPAHLRTVLTQTQMSIPVSGGQMVLGTWQGLYLFEHRRHPHRRSVVMHLMGE
ncbi:hypothetical protein AA103196_2404 [Ameyamaea chiangmaiensis NBRC 103196]|uniref:YjbQ family protein n=1 Tax=Ameyamaea chiangmaiensis TaxID=442969 RepID=A0A850P7U1_9PROT|nr:secondary thiamine-phosphate synthase enzyme YjbQ [Ameyamaea chiangmaiensis]MBS4075341.1 secondary thiamine-phosphate synthase enzyme YjbQ [Ameyamaea chiangmaiensis]NVN40667.1 YjbQ family protein [Ameyamaea chiangmaiensis]GBQ70121.1 hypothetical protein AA103196_2404 [Ameyamaea chiangmaiensis NBRC 103196]